MSTLSVIGTPIGNMEDITLRALRVLKEADLVLCEDTRVTRNLFEKYGITTATESYHAQSALSKIDHVISLLEEGKHVALVSDAGTPGISDPGSLLIARVREYFGDTGRTADASSVRIEAIPGPSALTALISIAGVPCADFVFLGFLPHKKGRATLMREITANERTVIFYESPHRIMKTLESLKEHLEAPDIDQSAVKKVVIGRELTKVFEEVVKGTASDLIEFFTTYPDKIRGEFVVIVYN